MLPVIVPVEAWAPIRASPVNAIGPLQVPPPKRTAPKRPLVSLQPAPTMLMGKLTVMDANHNCPPLFTLMVPPSPGT
jgi:hypothetical protein